MLWETSVFNELDEMRRGMEALAEWDGVRRAPRAAYPCLNAYETRDEYVLAVFAPGLAKDKLDIRADEGSLTVSGNRPLPVEEGPDQVYLRHERGHGSFEKTFRFPSKVNRGGVEARLENGILSIRVPKAEETKPKTIEIRT